MSEAHTRVIWFGYLMQMTPDLLEKVKSGQTATSENPKDVTYLLIHSGEKESPVNQYEGTEQAIDLGENWNILHYLLAGSSGKEEDFLSKAIFGGKEIGFVVGKNGPAKYLTPQEVKEVSAALARVNADELKSKYDANTIFNLSDQGKIYAPRSLEQLQSPQELERVIEGFERVRDYYKDTANKGNAILQWVSQYFGGPSSISS